MKFIRIWICLVALLVSIPVSLAQQGQPVADVKPNVIENLVVSKSGGNTILKLGLQQVLASTPSNFVIVNPARIVFDFPATENGLGYGNKTVNEGSLRSFSLVQAGDRSRLVLNLDRVSRFEARQDGKFLFITLFDGAPAIADGAAGKVQHFTQSGKDDLTRVRDIRFQRNKDGAGLVLVELSSSDTGIDVRQKGTTLQVSFKKTQLPETLRRRLDVVDFATPITSVNTRVDGDDVSMDIVPHGLWEHTAYQSDNQFIVEVRPVQADPNKLFQGTKAGYQGELISLNFQNIPLRELLHVFADITKFNIVISDSVAGNVSLRLNDVPWDQALEIVLEQKNLAMRKNGNILRIAPRDELLAKERQELESLQQIGQLEPTQTESFQINYQKADDLQKLLGNKDQPVLSKGGSVVVDAYSNRLFVTDVPTRLDKVRQLINLIDKPAKQVLIEARVVEARDTFGRELGVRLNFLNAQPVKVASDSGSSLLLGGGAATIGSPSATGRMASTTFTQQTTMGALSFSLFNSSLTRILNLELLAMEADGKGKSLSNPRVVTGNNVKAVIEQGDEIPVVTPAAANTPPTVTYRKAKLSLDVTPQITPDGSIKMKLIISKDRPDFSRIVLGNPTIITAKVESEVMVENGGTLVIGGVTHEDVTVSEDRIPFFGDLPYVGFMFKHKNKTSERKELLIFITPRIVDDRLSLR